MKKLALISLLALTTAACSAGDNGGGNGTTAGTSGNTAGAILGSAGNNGNASGSSNAGGGLGVSGNTGTGTAGSGVPPANIGTETVCDGLDDNNNGIIDDKDEGKDGLCDCLNIGFFGSVQGTASGATSASFLQWLTERSDIPVKQIAAATPITAEVLNGLQVLVIGNLSPDGQAQQARVFTDAEIAAFELWVNNGGGVISLTGYGQGGDATSTNNLFKNLGIGYANTNLGPGLWNATHPVTMAPPQLTSTPVEHPVSDQVSNLGLFYGYPITTTANSEIFWKEGSNTVGAVTQVGNGRIAMWGDEWITLDVLWVDYKDMQIPRFWLNMFRNVTPANECQVPIPPDIDIQ